MKWCSLILLCLLWLPGCGGDRELFEQARRERIDLLYTLEQEVSQLPELAKQAETLTRELEQLQKSTGEEAPEPPDPEVTNPEVPGLTSIDRSLLDEFQRSELNEMEAQIERLKDELPKLEERRLAVARLKAKLEILKAEP